MTWSSPRTWVTSEVVTAAEMNQEIRDNEGFLFSAHSARVFNSANQSIPDSTSTALLCDTEVYDSDGLHSTSVNTSRITVVSALAGFWLFVGALSYDNNVTGNRRDATLTKNGTTDLGYSRATPNATVQARPNITSSISMAASDYVELFAFQDRGGALNVLGSATGALSYLLGVYLGG